MNPPPRPPQNRFWRIVSVLFSLHTSGLKLAEQDNDNPLWHHCYTCHSQQGDYLTPNHDGFSKWFSYSFCLKAFNISGKNIIHADHVSRFHECVHFFGCPFSCLMLTLNSTKSWYIAHTCLLLLDSPSHPRHILFSFCFCQYSFLHWFSF